MIGYCYYLSAGEKRDGARVSKLLVGLFRFFFCLTLQVFEWTGTKGGQTRIKRRMEIFNSSESI